MPITECTVTQVVCDDIECGEKTEGAVTLTRMPPVRRRALAAEDAKSMGWLHRNGKWWCPYHAMIQKCMAAADRPATQEDEG